MLNFEDLVVLCVQMSMVHNNKRQNAKKLGLPTNCLTNGVFILRN